MLDIKFFYFVIFKRVENPESQIYTAANVIEVSMFTL